MPKKHPNTLFEKSNFCPKSQHFHEFFTPKKIDNFLVKSKLSTAKKSKTTTFSRVFHPKKIDNFLVKSKLSTVKKSQTTTFSRVFHPQKFDNFLGKSMLNFWRKNEDFEQCEYILIGIKKSMYTCI